MAATHAKGRPTEYSEKRRLVLSHMRTPVRFYRTGVSCLWESLIPTRGKREYAAEWMCCGMDVLRPLAATRLG